MKIALVFPRLKTFSGAEHLTLELAAHLSRWGHRVTIITRGFDDGCRSHLASGVEVKLPRLGAFLTGVHLVDSFLDVAFSPLLLREIPDDAEVLCFVSDPVLPAMWLYDKLARRPLPTVYYCLQPPRFVYDLMAETVAAHKPLSYLIPLFAGPYRWMDRIAARSCRSLLAISREYADWCRSLYGVEEVRRVPPGVDLELAKHAGRIDVRKRHGLEADDLLVLTVNKLIARKNLDLFLRVMRRVTERIPRARAVVVGDGPLERPLRELRDELDLEERVIFTGFLPELSQVADYYVACDLYVFLEKNVPFGLTVVEAAACGKPVLALRGGGTCDTVLDGETGRLLDPPPTVDAIADEICRLLERPDERIAMGEKARRHVRRFSWDSTARRFLQALEEAVEESVRPESAAANSRP